MKVQRNIALACLLGLGALARNTCPLIAAPSTTTPVAKEPSPLTGAITLGSSFAPRGKGNRLERAHSITGVYGFPDIICPPVKSGQPSLDSTLPVWATAVTLPRDSQHTLLLYRRSTQAIGFLINQTGIVDAIAVARLAGNSKTK
ncbi:MAG: hypothetical protein JO316_24625 [Abitibacteriaceae bacterium]|nr:hypothetical protein [Abditibacteriaceae bacterium]